MKRELIYLAPLRAGIILAILYGILALIFMPVFILVAVLGAKAGGGGHAPVVFGLVFAILMPVLYAGVGFVGGVVMAALYNLIAKWTGGLEFEVRDVAPPL